MKKLFLLPLLSLVALGCASNGKLTEAEFNQKLVRSEGLVQVVAGATTTTTLLLVKDTSKRASIAKDANLVSQVVLKAIADESLDLHGVRDLAADLILKQNFENREAVGYLFTVLSDVVITNVNISFKDEPETSKTAATRAMIRGVARGVYDATRPYAQSSSTRPAMLEDPDYLKSWRVSHSAVNYTG